MMIPSQISENNLHSTQMTDQDLVGWIAVQLDKVLTPGALAELRRITPEDPWCPAVWRLLADQRFDHFLSGNDAHARQSEKTWAFIIHVMALTTGLHDRSTPIGKVLANSGFSEIRLNRLLKAQDSQLFEQVSSVARFLKSKGERFDTSDLAALLLAKPGTERCDYIRNRIARWYFTTLAKSEKE
ncbi:type I-E CRISPR-associated protein Cse2/CasB [bacterium]|nr:type I-E CRISPR-associated protein Cse2/CasB [candidate division CSSED10-310 bacterium]